jgi:hypothetical protein
MALIAAAAIGGAASLGGSIFSGIFGASAAQQQARAIEAAAETARRTALELDQRARRDMAPFRQYGVEAGDLAMRLLRPGGNVALPLQESPLFRWQQELGMREINRELAARGLYGSGAGLEQLQRFTNQLVAEEGDRYFQRLYNMTVMGQNAASRMATGTTMTGANLADLTGRMGIAQAGAIGAAGQSLASIGTGIADTTNQFLNNYLLASRLPMSSSSSLSSEQPMFSRDLVRYGQGGYDFLVNAPAALRMHR